MIFLNSPQLDQEDGPARFRWRTWRTAPNNSARTRGNQTVAPTRRTGKQPWTFRQWIALASVLAGYVVGSLVASGTAISLPTISRELSADHFAVQWFVIANALATTCLVLVAGFLGDRFGRRLVLAVACLLFTLGMVLSALADSMLVLILARALAGVGSAGLMACGAAVLTSSFDGKSRIKVFAICGAAGGIGMAIGPSLAGWLVDLVGWRGMFWMLSGLSLLMTVGSASIAESRSAVRRKFDLLGSLTLVSGLGLLLLAISSLTSDRWAEGLIELAAATALLTVAVIHSLRVDTPLLEMRILKDRRVAAWMVSSIVPTAGTSGLMVYLPTYLLVVHLLSPAEAGAWVLSYTIPLFIAPMVISRWVNAGHSAARVSAVSLALSGVALLGFAAVSAVPMLWAGMIPMAVLGFSVGALGGLSDGQLMASVDRDHIGIASGLLNTIRQGVTAILLAVFGAAIVVALNAQFDSAAVAQLSVGDPANLPRESTVAGYGFAWGLVMAANSILLLGGAAAYYLLWQSARRR